MKNFLSEATITVLLILLSWMFYHYHFFEDIDTVFISISTFLFTIFSGFFVSRQGNRYTDIREKNSILDAKFSTIYRFAGHLGETFQQKIGAIIMNHYNLEKHEWDYSFTHKTTTLIDIHRTLDEFAGSKDLNGVESAAVGRITFALAGAQDTRKQLVALMEERIPRFQWGLMVIFTMILLVTVASIPSKGELVSSMLKAAFAASVISVTIILQNLDSLRLFEGTIGEHSANDVVNIIKGSK